MAMILLINNGILKKVNEGLKEILWEEGSTQE